MVFLNNLNAMKFLCGQRLDFISISEKKILYRNEFFWLSASLKLCFVEASKAVKESSYTPRIEGN